MAEITYNYKDSKNNLDTYDGVVAALDLIYSAISHEFKEKENIKISSSIEFESGESSYDCDSLDDFKKYAFDKTISIKQIRINVAKKEVFAPNILTIWYYRSSSHKNGVFKYDITSNNELLIANIVDFLKKGNMPVIHRTETHIDNSIHIGNGNNIIGSAIGQNNSVTNDAEKNKKESLFSKISWKLIVPIIVIVVGAAICVWLGLKQ